MSLKKRFADFGDGLGSSIEERAKAAPAQAGEQKTAPGHLMTFQRELDKVSSEADAMRERLEAFEGAVPVKQLDPNTIRLSAYANRHPESFSGPEFESLKQDIAHAGGNVQAIKVRPIEGQGDVKFELIFGSRRHRACLELGLPVLSQIEVTTDQDLYMQMDRENRARADLTPFEQGQHYKRALDAKLWPSQAKLAEALKVNRALVVQAIALASLPAAVLEAFPSTRQLQFRWSSDLAHALQRNPEAVLSAAKDLTAAKGTVPAKQVFERLTGTSGRTTDPVPITVRGTVVGQIQSGKTGTAITLAKVALTEPDLAALGALIEGFLQTRVSA